MPYKLKPCPKCGKPIRSNNATCRECVDWQSIAKIPSANDYSVTRNCRVCGVDFRITHSRQYTCESCRTQLCVVCGKLFKVRYAGEERVTCSHECSVTWNAAPILRCEWCGVDFKQRRGRPMKHCSQTCRYAASIKHNQEDRRSYKYRQWRTAVLERDGYQCQDCGALEHLQAHHIREWQQHPEQRFDISNGVTLCQTCHSKEHGGMIIPRTVQRMPICSICGVQTKGKSDKCRSCAMKLSPKAKAYRLSLRRDQSGHFTR